MNGAEKSFRRRGKLIDPKNISIQGKKDTFAGRKAVK